MNIRYNFNISNIKKVRCVLEFSINLHRNQQQAQVIKGRKHPNHIVLPSIVLEYTQDIHLVAKSLKTPSATDKMIIQTNNLAKLYSCIIKSPYNNTRNI